MLRILSARERKLAGKSVLVTGAGGFIGSHLTERLLEAGCKVRALVRYNSSNSKGYLNGLVHPQLEVRSGDVTDAHFVQSLVEGCQIVYHLAALIAIPYSYHAPGSYVETNINGTLNLLQASLKNKVDHFVQTSTSEVYGSALYTPMDEKHPLHPQSPYAATKVGSDQLALSFNLSFGLPVTVLRPFNTYGPRQSQRAVVPSICLQAIRGNQLLLGNVSSERDLTYVEDTCAGFLHTSLCEQAVGQTINLGVGVCHRVDSLARRVGSLLDKRLEIVEDPDRLRPPNSEVDRLLSDNSLARVLLDWEPLISLDDGLAELIKWLSLRKDTLGASYAL